MNRRLACLCCLLMISLLVSSCGFRLRGMHHYQLPDALQTIAIKNNVPHSLLTQDVKALLERRDVNVVNPSGQAATTLYILSEETTQNTITVSSTTIVRQLTMYYHVEFQLLDKQMQSIIPPQTITVSRLITLDANQLLGSTSQEVVIQTEMRKDMAQKILDRLSSKQVREALGEKDEDPT